jgi:uncharacterized protein (DUF58 family)
MITREEASEAGARPSDGRAHAPPAHAAPAPARIRNLLAVTSSTGVVRRYHSHTSGVLYIGFTLLLAVGAINSQNNLLFLALGLSIGGLLISGLLSGASLMGVRVVRRVPSRAVVGQPLRITYRVFNANRVISGFGLHVLEVLTHRHTPPWSRLGRQPRTFVTHVAPASESIAELVLTPRIRGRIVLDAVQIWSTFPFGLTRKSVTFPLPCSILVLPPNLPLRPGLVSRFTSRSHSGVGEERAAGHGEEFFGLREYISGDSLRRIAWKRTARTGQLVVRQNAMPSPPRLWVLINFPAVTTAADRELNAEVLAERAIAIAASILRAASASGMAAGLAAPAAHLVHPPREGRAHLNRLLTDLAMLDAQAIRGRSARPPAAIARGAACVVIHAGPIDPSCAPPGAHHLSATQAEQYLAADDQGSSSLLALIDSAVQAPPARRRFGRRREHARERRTP